MLVLHLTVANLKMILRNRQALFWALAFPLVFVFVFAMIGSFSRSSAVTVGVVDRAKDDASRQLLSGLDAFDVVMRDDEAQARLDARSGDLGYLLIVPERLASLARDAPPASVTLVYEEGRQGAVALAVERALARMDLALAGVSPKFALNTESLASDDLSFAQLALPGLVLWGIMSNSIIGMAVVLANYREKKIFRRIKVSPMRARTFFAAQVMAYLALSLAQAAAIFGIGAAVMRVDLSGNLLAIGLLIVACNIVFLNLGFIVGAFSKTAAAASGLGNLVVLPMVMMSGVFFPLDVLPRIVAAVTRFLPLSPMVEALRGVAIGSKALSDFPLEIALIAAWLALTSMIAVRIFKFE